MTNTQQCELLDLMTAALVFIRLQLKDDCKPLKEFSYSSGEIFILFFICLKYNSTCQNIFIYVFYVDEFGVNSMMGKAFPSPLIALGTF